MVDLLSFQITLVITIWDSGTASENHNDDGTNGNAPLSKCEPDMGMLSRKKKDNEIYVQCFNPLQINTNTEENENNSILAIKSKRKKMQILQWALKIVLTLEESMDCSHLLGNCAELASWEVLHGEMNS
ncbi:hypothetical protein RhiirC2_802262 [Rhizophagus irregularis]|uniref:Uncharacterized protein n=1 Tax=Rhizophagus irregularis TaxID=588596 RepID=A0A2N1M1H6_9GLOM|nr:hypothetical protein RhiirC2_802262 [Rhizophagus irregularis]